MSCLETKNNMKDRSIITASIMRDVFRSVHVVFKTLLL